MSTSGPKEGGLRGERTERREVTLVTGESQEKVGEKSSKVLRRERK